MELDHCHFHASVTYPNRIIEFFFLFFFRRCSQDDLLLPIVMKILSSDIPVRATSGESVFNGGYC
jgi:hypothetical protein